MSLLHDASRLVLERRGGEKKGFGELDGRRRERMKGNESSVRMLFFRPALLDLRTHYRLYYGHIYVDWSLIYPWIHSDKSENDARADYCNSLLRLLSCLEIGFEFVLSCNDHRALPSLLPSLFQPSLLHPPSTFPHFLFAIHHPLNLPVPLQQLSSEKRETFSL